MSILIFIIIIVIAYVFLVIFANKEIWLDYNDRQLSKAIRKGAKEMVKARNKANK